MVSTHKVVANRRNAARSTGPKTARGKARARRNAYKHGLAIPVLNDPAISKEIERVARSMVGKRNGPYELAQARVAAEAEFDLHRVRAARVKIIEQAIGAANELGAVVETQHALETHDSPAAIGAPMLRAFLRALPELETMDRYERRALSRRGRAIREIYRSDV